MKITQGGRNKRINIGEVMKKMGLNVGDELEVKNLEKLNKKSKQFTILVKKRGDDEWDRVSIWFEFT